MQKVSLFIILLLCCHLTATDASAADAQKHTQFSRFFTDFQDAIENGDKEKVAGMTDFIRFTWEEGDIFSQVKTKEAFLKNYDGMFTSAIRSKIANVKPTKIDDNSYFINWFAKHLEYSLFFARNEDGSFKFFGLTVGPD